jgi:hypothetical protein
MTVSGNIEPILCPANTPRSASRSSTSPRIATKASGQRGEGRDGRGRNGLAREDDDLLAAREELFDHVEADEARQARHQHRRHRDPLRTVADAKHPALTRRRSRPRRERRSPQGLATERKAAA